MKRLLGLLLSLLLPLTLTACGAAGAYQDISAPEDAVSAADEAPAAEPADSQAAEPADDQDAETVDSQEAEDTAVPETGAGASVRLLDTSRPMVALTFDDGPHAEYTSQILDVLEENGAVATFFEVARNLSADPDSVRRAAAMGCEIGSHSYRHADLSKMSASTLQADLEAADAAFIQVLGYAPTLLRPPYGSLTRAQRLATGRSIINWSVDTMDWSSRDASSVIAQVQSAKQLDGQVILLHSLYESTVEAVRTLVPWLQEQGYQLVTISELITLRFGDQLEAGGLYNYDYFQYNVPALAETSSAQFAGLTLAEGSPENSPLTVKLVMTRGTYTGSTLGGGYGEVNYSGSCEWQVWRDGKLLSTCAVTSPTGESELLFSDTGDSGFSLLFDDYNGDGLPDFTLGQYLSSNIDSYSIYTLDEDGTVRSITTPFAIACDSSGYSAQFDLVDGGFTVSSYNNVDGQQHRTTYLWDSSIGYFIPYAS